MSNYRFIFVLTALFSFFGIMYGQDEIVAKIENKAPSIEQMQDTFDFAHLVAITAISLIAGYLSKYIPFLSNVSKTAIRVTATIVPTVILVCVFGWNYDTIAVLKNVFWALSSSALLHDFGVKPFLLKNGENV